MDLSVIEWYFIKIAGVSYSSHFLFQFTKHLRVVVSFNANVVVFVFDDNGVFWIRWSSNSHSEESSENDEEFHLIYSTCRLYVQRSTNGTDKFWWMFWRFYTISLFRRYMRNF